MVSRILLRSKAGRRKTECVTYGDKKAETVRLKLVSLL